MEKLHEAWKSDAFPSSDVTAPHLRLRQEAQGYIGNYEWNKKEYGISGSATSSKKKKV